MQPELPEECGQPARHAPIPGNNRHPDQRRRPSPSRLRQHVRAQQLKTRQTHPPRRPLRERLQHQPADHACDQGTVSGRGTDQRRHNCGRGWRALLRRSPGPVRLDAHLGRAYLAACAQSSAAASPLARAVRRDAVVQGQAVLSRHARQVCVHTGLGELAGIRPAAAAEGCYQVSRRPRATRQGHAC